ncbi:MAG TPA: CARDB domain-containing protein [Thermoanaerobaculia bacterium]|jgi:subtilase family serine protease|nr:CARDB domain-containing protein [Thermoanaerobaculia bacterium]
MENRAGDRMGGPSAFALRLALGLALAGRGYGTAVRVGEPLGVFTAAAAAAAASELPDLLIRAAEESPLSATKLRVEVVNRGRGASRATRLTLFYQRAGEVTRRLAPVPALAAGEAAWTTVDAGAPLAAAARLTLRVDDPPAVAESDELNNDFSFK